MSDLFPLPLWQSPFYHEETVQDDWLAARICPVPRRIMHGYSEMADARQDIEGVRAEHRHDPQIFGAILDDNPTVYVPGAPCHCHEYVQSGCTPKTPIIMTADPKNGALAKNGALDG